MKTSLKHKINGIYKIYPDKKLYLQQLLDSIGSRLNPEDVLMVIIEGEYSRDTDCNIYWCHVFSNLEAAIDGANGFESLYINCDWFEEDALIEYNLSKYPRRILS